MNGLDMKSKDLQTRAIRAGLRRTPQGEHSLPIYATSSFVFESSKQAADRFAEVEPGNIYSRFTNPTTLAFENKLAALEGAERCVATASGMAAIATLCYSMLEGGDHVVAAAGLFGSTTTFFNKYLAKFGVRTQTVSTTDLDEWADAVRPETRMLFVETPSNPLCEIVDIGKLKELAGECDDCLLVVDSSTTTPVLQLPLELGADVVVYAATKFLDGHGRAVGGAVVTNRDDIADNVFACLRTTGASMSPFNAWTFCSGLETLALRVREASKSAMEIARWLDRHPKVKKVYYPGLEHHQGHDLAKKQQSDFGAVLSFEVDGGRKNAWKLIDSTEMISITANLGDVKTIITHPASTTHARITEEQRMAAGITEGLIRLSVGLEATSDIMEDIEAGLSAI